MTRLAFALALLLGGVALAQPATYFPPIAARTPGTSPVGPAAMQVTLWLSDPGVDVAQSLLFGTGSDATVPFRLDTQAAATVNGLPPSVQAVATAPGVLVDGSYRTLVAVSTGGSVIFGTIENGAFVGRGPLTPISATTQLALSAVPDAGAALLVSDGFQITRWDLDASGNQVSAIRRASISASPGPGGDESNALVFDGLTNDGFVGGRVIGDLYRFDASMDGGPPAFFDAALASQGRLSAPVTGLAVYSGQNASYLLAANGQGITLYDLLRADPRGGAIRIIPQDDAGQITAPAGIAVTNLGAGLLLPAGVIAVGDRSQTDLALVSWGTLAGLVDGGLVVDTTTDPRGLADSGSSLCPDGGVPDGGSCGPSPNPGPGPAPNPKPPPGRPVAVEQPSSCATAAGAPVLLALLAGLGLLVPRRRQRR